MDESVSRYSEEPRLRGAPTDEVSIVLSSPDKNEQRSVRLPDVLSPSHAEADAQSGLVSSDGLCGAFRSWSRKEKLMVAGVALAEGVGFAALSVIAPVFPPLVSLLPSGPSPFIDVHAKYSSNK
jgi:hypothetical protein